MSYLQPLLGLSLALCFVGLGRLRHYRGFGLAFAGALGVLLLSLPPVDWALSRPLEMWYPVRPLPDGPADAIVVLSSQVKPPVQERPYTLLGEDTFGRVEYAAWLFRTWRPLPVLACAGAAAKGAPPSSVPMRELLGNGGVPERLIWTEDRSRSTRENALYSAEILRRHGVRSIALVVDARSMPRAAACFRRLGILVTPAPSDFNEMPPFPDVLLPSWKAVRGNEETLHETLGLAWYWLRGWI